MHEKEQSVPNLENIPSEGEIVSLKRKLAPFWQNAVYAVASAMAVYHIYILAFAPVDPWMFSSAHLQFVFILGFIFYAGWKGGTGGMGVLDVVLIGASLASYLYIMLDFDSLVDRAGAFPEGYDMLFGCITILLVLELCRRTAGLVLTLLVLSFLAYCFIGPYLPGILWHKGYSIERVVSYMFSPTGIYNIPLGVTARFVYIFVLFGAFLELSKTAPFFMDFSYALAGRSRGGPAKVAVISSGLLGMVNGTSTGNVVTTGSLTIPLMKRTGYSPYFAGAVEAVASTGGQIMPPVMGAAVFLMAQMMNTPYTEIMVAAALPALLYYIALYATVDIEAGRLGLKGVDKELLPAWKGIRAQAHLALPIFVLLFYLLVLNSSVVLAGLMGLLASVVIAVLDGIFRTQKMFTPREFLNAVRDGGVNVISITATCAAAGIIIGVLTLTGLGLKVATIVVQLSGGNLLALLLLTMGVTILLGMGLPTIAAYAIPAAVVVPAMVELGVPLLPAHLFVLYYASLSAITPPVALASYAAAAIAGVSPIRLAVVGLKLGLPGFIIPFMFVYGPQLLLLGELPNILLAAASATMGVLSLAVAIIGYLRAPVSLAARCLYFAAALLLIKPGGITDLAGALLLACLVGLHFRRNPAARPQKAAMLPSK